MENRENSPVLLILCHSDVVGESLFAGGLAVITVISPFFWVYGFDRSEISYLFLCDSCQRKR